MSKLVLNQSVVAQFIGDENFYVQCPAYFFMKEAGMAAHAKWQKALIEGRDDCDNCNDRGILKPAVATFASHTVRMHEQDPQLLKPLIAYLTKRLRGKRPCPILLYYQGPTGVQNISF